MFFIISGFSACWSNFYLFFPLIVAAVNLFRVNLLKLLIIAIILQLLINKIEINLILIIDNYKDYGILYYFCWYWVRYCFFQYGVYFFLGIYFFFNADKIMDDFSSVPKQLGLALLTLALISLLAYRLLLINEHNINFILQFGLLVNIPFILLLFLFSRKLAGFKSCITRVLSAFGKYSFGIYLIQSGFILYVIRMLKIINIDYHSWHYYFLCFTISSIGSFIITYMIALLPFSKYLIGAVRSDPDQIKTTYRIRNRSFF